MWAPGGAVNALQELTPRIVLLRWFVQTLVCCLREPCGKVQSHRQWPQGSGKRSTGTNQRTRAKVRTLWTAWPTHALASWLKICLRACLVKTSSITSTWAFHLRYFVIFNLIKLLFNVADQLNPVHKIHKMRTMAVWSKTTSSTGYEPNVIDNSGYSETSAMIFQDESVDIDTQPSYSFDAELDDELIRKSLSSQLFTQEQEEPANLRQTYHSHEESLLPAQSLFTRTSTGRPVYEPSSNLSQKWKSSRDLENKQIRILHERQKEQILAEVRSEIQKNELQAESDRRSVQELNGIIDFQRIEIEHTITRCEQSRRDQLLLQDETSEQKSRNFQEENWLKTLRK